MNVRQQERARPAIAINERLFRLDETKGGCPVLLGGRCPDCRYHFFPRRAICPGCGRMGLETVDLSGSGKIWTYTIAHQVPPGAIVQAPYVVAQVELPEGVRVGALITECSPDSVSVGLDVEIVPVKVREDEEGRDVLAFAFRPMGKAEEAKS